MKIIIALVSMFMTTQIFAAALSAPSLEDIGLNEQSVMKLRKQREAATDEVAISKKIADSFEDDDFMSAVYTDQALAAIVSQAVNVLTFYGHVDEAQKIKAEYAKNYSTAYVTMFLDNGSVDKEIGDRPPVSKWIDDVHTQIEDALGLMLCKYFHLHDMYVLNYAIPTVFSPELYAKKDYLDAFAGHPITRLFWEHHGVAGIVTYWAVNLTCMVGTSGMGAATFICGPISSIAENAMDRRIAPPVGTRIWERAQKE